MANLYSKIFKISGTKAFSSAGLLARMPLSMTAIGIMTMLSQASGSYILAGSVAATFTLTMALAAPQISKVVDRYGQSRVLPYVTAFSVFFMLLMLICVRFQAPNWALFLFAMLAGFTPSMPAIVRARWAEIYRGKPELHTAFSFESVLDEICFIIGPPISVGLSIMVFPEAGPLAAAVFLSMGITLFVLQKKTEPPIYPISKINTGSTIKMFPMQILVLTLLALGTVVGSIDIISIAFATEQGNTAAASIVLSAYAIGSCGAGLLFGTMKINTPLPKLFLYAALATAIAGFPLLIVSTILTLSLAVLVAGAFVAPTMIIAMGLVESIVPKEKTTEGLTWMITGLFIGIACGAALAGWVVDFAGITMAFGVTVLMGVLVLLVAISGYGALSKAVR